MWEHPQIQGSAAGSANMMVLCMTSPKFTMILWRHVNLRIKCENGDLISADEEERRQLTADEVEPGHVEEGRQADLLGQRQRHDNEWGVEWVFSNNFRHSQVEVGHLAMLDQIRSGNGIGWGFVLSRRADVHVQHLRQLSRNYHLLNSKKLPERPSSSLVTISNLI